VHPRAQDPEELADIVSGYGLTPEVVSSVGQAVRLALAEAEPEDVILACGSLFVVAEARAAARSIELVSD
jgi:dihydrofolate synthase / folylpolyglutamate synthase